MQGLASLFCLAPLAAVAWGSGFDGPGIDARPQLQEATALSRRVATEAAARKGGEAPKPTGDQVLDGIRSRFAGAPVLDPADSSQRRRLVGILTGGVWTCRRYQDGSWRREEGATTYRTVMFSSDEIREYDEPRRPDRPYLRYRVGAPGLAAMYGFLILRVVDDTTLIKEFSDTSRPPGDTPSLVAPSQALRWYTVCTKSPK